LRVEGLTVAGFGGVAGLGFEVGAGGIGGGDAEGLELGTGGGLAVAVAVVGFEVVLSIWPKTPPFGSGASRRGRA
jgi:hypothetical protein